jgi:hypothetical protein
LNSNKRILAVLLVVVLLGVGATTALYLASRGGSPPGRPLPSGCVKPAGGFLVVASGTGYNDSMGHGVPEENWPIITVEQGQNVTIVVCNIDVQPHGFQVTHYDDQSEVTIVPGQVYRVSFVADQAGSFAIYCEIFCTIHWAMQSGLLKVTAS